MKRAFLIIIPILLVVSFIVYAVNSHRAYKAKIEAKKAQKERVEKNVTSAVGALLKKYNASDWVKEIKGRKDILDPILTVELEQLWLTHRPTFFIGKIKDISTFDNDYYSLKIQVIAPVIEGIELAIKCPMQKVNSLIKEHPNLTGGFQKEVAIVANIDKIKTVGGKDSIRIGEGKSIDIVYVEDVWIWYNLVR